MAKVQNLRGTRDFYPEDFARLRTMFSTWSKVCEEFGYEEFEGPILESSQLWKLKSGNEIPEQMYAFMDKSDSEIAIRPEMTPTLARMVAARQKQLPKPIRWYTIPRCFRYEAPQKGRLREFFQLNVDLLGPTNMSADAEVIATAIEIMRAFGCTEKDFFVRLGNRKVISAMLTLLKVEKATETCRLIDKIDKLKKEDFLKELDNLVPDAQQVYDLITEKDWKKSVEALRAINGSEETKELLETGVNELTELVTLLENYCPADFYEVDFSIMRGLDYYTSTVFEVFDRRGKMRAFAGGGRYDNLVGDFGGDACPGVGYGMGDVSLGVFLDELGLLPEYKKNIDYFVIPVGDDMRPQAIQVATKLREKYFVELEVMGRKLTKALTTAANSGAKNIVIVGKKDVDEGVVTIRNLESGDESKVKLEKISSL